MLRIAYNIAFIIKDSSSYPTAYAICSFLVDIVCIAIPLLYVFYMHLQDINKKKK